MTGASFFPLLILLVSLERSAELVISERNVRWSMRQGGQEFGRGHYPAMVVLHVGLLLGCLLEFHVADRHPIPVLETPDSLR